MESNIERKGFLRRREPRLALGRLDREILDISRVKSQIQSQSHRETPALSSKMKSAFEYYLSSSSSSPSTVHSLPILLHLRHRWVRNSIDLEIDTSPCTINSAPMAMTRLGLPERLPGSFCGLHLGYELPTTNLPLLSRKSARFNCIVNLNILRLN